MIGKVTYHQQVSYCGKPRCKKCREGTGHGPYWYSYQTVDGRTTRTYVGKNLPAEALASIEGLQPPSPVYQSELEQEKATIRIYTLGQFRLERRTSPSNPEWHTVTEAAWQHQRVRGLLSCLLSSPGRKLGREQIMDALWPELDLETATNRLDRAVYSLRQLFEPSRGKLATSPLLLTEREVLVLAEQVQVWVDADAFERLLIQARESNDPGKKEKLLEEAMLLYGGDFLPEAQRAEWSQPRRDSLMRAWIGLLLELSDIRNEREAFASAIEPLDKLLAVDPANEAAVQRLMLRLAILGRRGEALRAYRKLASVLQQEYRISPLPDTRAIYERVRGGQRVPTESAGAPSSGTQLAGAEASRTPTRSDAPATIQIGRSHQSPLVGREEEVALLRELVTSTEQAAKFKMPGAKKSSVLALDTQRRPQCMLLMGEVGIGKTRLAEEVSRDAKRRNWAVAWSRVYAQEGSIPYRLWTEVLRKAMEQGAWQRQEVSKRSLVFQPLSTLLPDVLQPLLVQSTYSSSLPPEQEQLRLWEAACELLKLISESTPLLIALDDLQWADASSCELFAYLSRRVQGYPIVIVGTCRDNELPANHPLRPLLTDLQREHAVECLSLAPLSDEQIDALVSSIQVPQSLVQRIRKRAAGNPFFAEELARTIASSTANNGTFANDGTTGPNGKTGPDATTGPDGKTLGTRFIASGDSSPSPADDSTYQLPETITAVLDLRLGRLTQPCQRMLSKAAVLGGSFEFNVISAMEASTPGSDEDAVLDLLEEALKSGMLTEQGTGTRITYDFWHPLLVNHLYEKLSAARRASLHRRAADILQRIYRGHEEEEAEIITYHLVGGGADSEIIARYAEMAANRDNLLSAYPQAEYYYRIAIEHLESFSDDQLHLAYLLECLGECIRVQGKYKEARSFFERALEVREQYLKSTTIAPSQREGQLQAMLWCQIGWTWYNAGNYAQAQQHYERAEQVLREVETTSGTIWATIRLRQSRVFWKEGNYEEALRTAHEALSLFEEVLKHQEHNIEDILHLTSTRRTLAGDPVDLGRVHLLLGLIANSVGQSKDALTHYNTALALYEQYDNLREIAIACCDLGDIHFKRSEYPHSQAVLRRSLNLAERIGDVPVMSFTLGNLGVLNLRTGNLIESETEFRRGIALAEHIDDPASVSLWNASLASALQDQGRISESRAILYHALRISRTMNIAFFTSIALIALGSMRLSQAAIVAMEERDSIQSNNKVVKLLVRAKKTLRRALALEGIEAETRADGQLILAQVMLQLGELKTAHEQVERTLEEGLKSESTWIVVRAQKIMGCILAAQGQWQQAEDFFEQALRMSRKYTMRLEQGRTLYHYGNMLVRQGDSSQKTYQQGISYLQEAQQIFEECKAGLDLEMVKKLLAKYDLAATK